MEAGDEPEPTKNFRNLKLDRAYIDIGRDSLEENTPTAGRSEWEHYCNLVDQLMQIRATKNPEFHGGFLCLCPNLSEEERKTCQCSAILGMEGQMKEADLMASSRGTYFGYVVAWKMRSNLRWTSAEYQVIKQLRKNLEKEAARTKKDKVIGLTPDQANGVLELLDQKNYDQEALALFLVGLLGPRFNGITKTEYRDFIIDEDPHRPGEQRVTIHVRRDKNKSDAKSKGMITESTGVTLLKKPEGWSAFVANCRLCQGSTATPFGHLTTSKVGAILRKIGAGVTTYGFRKHYAARVYAETGCKKKVSERMGHVNTKMAEAFYLCGQVLKVVDLYQKIRGWTVPLL